MTVNLSKEYLSQIPIKIASQDGQLKIVTLVDEILAMKEKKHSTDTSKLESRIDQLVNQLYGLSADEVEMIKG